MSHLKPLQEHLNRWTLGYVGLAIERCGPQPVLNGAFGTVPLSVGDWLRCTSIASSVLWAEELKKLAVSQVSSRPLEAPARCPIRGVGAGDPPGSHRRQRRWLRHGSSG